MGGILIMKDSLADRVRRGAKLLDRQSPGWEFRITPGLIAMESCDMCILGQLFGHYVEGYERLRMSLPSTFLFSASAHGFTIPDEDQTEGCWVVFRELANAWREEIRSRIF